MKRGFDIGVWQVSDAYDEFMEHASLEGLMALAGMCQEARNVPPTPIATRPRTAPRESKFLPSGKESKLAQKLGQLHPFIAVLPQECMGQLASFGPT